jgi:hypothetical protein
LKTLTSEGSAREIGELCEVGEIYPRTFAGRNQKAELALSEEQRTAVAARLEQLGLAEIACDGDHTMAVVVDLLEAFPSAKLSADQARSKARGYMDALKDVPTWAVFEARMRWLQARAGSQNYDYAPTPPKLRATPSRERGAVLSFRHS